MLKELEMEKLKKAFLRSKTLSIIVILLVSTILALLAKKFLIPFSDEINLFSFILGIISFILSILVLDSVTQREKVINTVLNNYSEHNVRQLLNEAMTLCQEILDHQTLKELNENNSFKFSKKVLELKIKLSSIQKANGSIELFKSYDKFISSATENLNMHEKVYQSYIKAVGEVYQELHLFKLDIEANNITNGL